MPPLGGRWDPPSWATVQGVPAMEPVRCPTCRCTVPAEMLRDLRMLPALGQDFGCDGCYTRLERAGLVTPLAYATAAGAPAHILAHLAAKIPMP